MPTLTAATRPEGTALDRDAQDLYEALSHLVRVYQFRDRQRICYHDVSVTQCYALDALIRLGPLRLDGLARELFLDKSTASRVVDALERKGYLRRGGDPEDGRALRILVTAKGRALHARIERQIVAEHRELASEVDPKVRRAAALLLRKIARAAESRFSEPGCPTDDATLRGPRR